jgi:hypothetical protein
MTTLFKLYYNSLIFITITLRLGLVNLRYFYNKVASVWFAFKSALFIFNFRLYIYNKIDLLAAEHS